MIQAHHHDVPAATVAGIQPPTLFLTDADVGLLADWRGAIEALRRAYGANFDPQSVPPRTMARVPGAWLRSLTAVSPLGGHLGCKLIAASTHLRRASYLIALFDPASMALAALLDGNQVTALRTAATAAVAVDALAPASKPLRVAVLGSGFEARAQLQALAAIRDLEFVAVYSPTAANRERFAADLGMKLSLPIQSVEVPEAAVAGMDVVICAARARGEIPLLRGEWLEPGMTLVSVGSTLPEQREVDVEVIERSTAIVADMPEEVAHDTGDMRAAHDAGRQFAAKLMSLTDVIGRRRTARATPADIVLYKSVGSALQDVVIAEHLLQQARLRGLGTAMPASIAPVAK